MDLDTFRERLREWPREQLRAAKDEYRDDYPAERLAAIEDELQRRGTAPPAEDPAWETPGPSQQATNCRQILWALEVTGRSERELAIPTGSTFRAAPSSRSAHSGGSKTRSALGRRRRTSQRRPP